MYGFRAEKPPQCLGCPVHWFYLLEALGLNDTKEIITVDTTFWGGGVQENIERWRKAKMRGYVVHSMDMIECYGPGTALGSVYLLWFELHSSSMTLFQSSSKDTGHYFLPGLVKRKTNKDTRSHGWNWCLFF